MQMVPHARHGPRRGARGVAPWFDLALPLALVLLPTVPASARPQTALQSPPVSGRVLDRESGEGVAGAYVLFTSPDTAAAAAAVSHAITDADGRYVATLAGGGPWVVRVERIGYLTRSVRLAGGVHSVSDILLQPRAIEISGVVVETRRQNREEPMRRTPGGREETRLSWFAESDPIEAGDLTALSALQSGVQLTGAGPSFLAQDPSQNRFALDGSVYGATSLPPEALASVTVVSNTFDVSRGAFSGGQVEAHTLSGTDLFGAAVRARMTAPWLQSATAAQRPESTFGYLTAGAGGALVRGRLFWYAASSLSRRSSPAFSLETAPPAAQSAAGLPPTAAARLLGLLQDFGASPTHVGVDDSRSDAASGLLRLDYDFARHHSLTLRLDGRDVRLGGLGLGPTASRTSALDVVQRGAGVFASVMSRFSRTRNEARAFATWSSDRTLPEEPGVTGDVLVADPGLGRSIAVRFGAGGFESRASTSLVELSDLLKVAISTRHEIVAGAEADFGHARSSSAANPLGAFSFANLDDVAAGRPSLYARSFDASSGEGSTSYGAIFLGETWSGQAAAVTYGVRAERSRWSPADLPPALPSTATAGRSGSRWNLSPRVGGRLALGTWSFRGGIGEFVGSPDPVALANAVAGGGERLICVGPAAPVPTWDLYVHDPASAPDACPGDAGSLTSRLADVNVVSPGFTPPRNWRVAITIAPPAPAALLGTHGGAWLDATFLHGTHLPLASDANLRSTPEFELEAEAGRPVFVPASAIDSASGGVALTASRSLPGTGIVRELRSDGTSSVAQLTATATFDFQPFFASASYTYERAVDQAGTLSAPGGSAAFAGRATLADRGTSDLERRHQLQLRVSGRLPGGVTVGILAQAASGAPFSPVVDGDANGDGVDNDPAFVFNPATDSQLAHEMRSLLSTAPSSVRRCLLQQIGTLARRNSCRSRWSAGLDLRLTLTPWRIALDRRLRISLFTRNGISLLDRSIGIGGSGDAPDATLLRIRGFDRRNRSFVYSVNPHFGRPLTGSVSRPFALILEGRFAIGADPARQALERLVQRSMTRARSPDELRRAMAHTIPNVPAQVVTLDSARSLHLSDAQRQRLLILARGFELRISPLADTLAVVQSALEAGSADRRDAIREARSLITGMREIIEASIEAAHAILVADQWARLPDRVRQPPLEILPPLKIVPGPAPAGG